VQRAFRHWAIVWVGADGIDSEARRSHVRHETAGAHKGARRRVGAWPLAARAQQPARPAGRFLNVCAGVAFSLAAILACHSVNAKIIQELVELPVDVSDFRGQVVKHRIKLTIIRDDAKVSSPFLILNHGRGATREINAARNIASFRTNARYFVSKGFTVFMPLRVGYGETSGPDVEFSGKCDARNFAPAYEAAVVQTIKVIEYAKALPYIVPASGIVVGQSFGGTTAIAIAAKSIAGVRAAINFAGGGGGRPQTDPEQPCSVERMTALFASYGATTKIPTLWLYSENDKYWGAAIPRTWLMPSSGAAEMAGSSISHRTRMTAIPADRHGPLSANTSTLALRISDGTSWC
jgi:dienelactone hydrolase